MRWILALLLIGNLVAFGWWTGTLAGVSGIGRDPERIARQVDAQRIRVLPLDRLTAPAAGNLSGNAAGPANGGTAAGPAENPASPSGNPVMGETKN